ncbi:DUF2231 domain-containing protein [Syntrophus aciditrophicus]|nr:DUF2231 domain-containing protein [Syntrophus aciditrophicus]
MTLYTAEELKLGDGKNGRPILFAYGGNVYEVSPESKLWKNGLHMGRHVAGTDLTKDMENSPHGIDALSKAQLVGKIVASPLPSIEHPPAWVNLLLSKHPHPVSSHFPIALSVTAALFSIVSILFDLRIMELASFFNLVVATTVMPFTILTGYLSWRYNYRRKNSFEFKAKILLSILLPFSMLGVLCLFGYQYFFTESYPTGPIHALYHVLVICTALNVVALGYFGGRITFPERR